MRNPISVVTKLYLFFTGFVNSVNLLLKCLSYSSDKTLRFTLDLAVG